MREQKNRLMRTFEKDFFLQRNNVVMAEWDELRRSKRGVAAAGRVVEALQRGCGLDRKSQHGRWRRNEEGEGYQRDIFIGPEFYFTETKKKKDSQGQTGVCRGKGRRKKMRPHVLIFLCFLILESKTKVIGADVILDTKWRTLRNVDIFFRAISHTRDVP